MTEKYHADRSDDLARFFSGEQLFGDDFSSAQIADWFDDEKEGYANLGAKNRDEYQYAYHSLNMQHAFRHLGSQRFRSALGIGSAYGDEFGPIAKRVEQLTILEASDALSGSRRVHGIPCQYQRPEQSGDIPFDDNSFDLISVLGVLHHIPNVSHVISECGRVLDNGGKMILREPIVSMGDWRRPRRGLTKRERGIPLQILHEIIGRGGFEIVAESLCVFPPLSIICGKLGIRPFNSPIATALDAWLSNMFSWNVKYHAKSSWQKIRPTAVCFVLEKPRSN